MTIRKKLIEGALPLEKINAASVREKSIRHGHPSTLHLWWARRPLAAARAVIFAQMVDDPSAHPELFPTEAAQEVERERLFRLIEQLVQWENTTNEELLSQARDEIWRSWRGTCVENKDHPRAAELFNPDKLPAFHDPFAGGGALPLEAQRLGLESYASDLNPVAVLVNKAMIEIPPKFAGWPPVNPKSRSENGGTRKERAASLSGASSDMRPDTQSSFLPPRSWKGAQGLAEDVRYYGQWMRDEAERRIGHLYPKIEVTAAMAKDRPDLKPSVGQKLTVIAWLWARTVKSPNPAFRHVDVPLASTFMLSTKAGGDFDADTRWALAWFEQYGFAEGEYGVAETLSKAKNTSVGGMVNAGFISSRGGKVRLLRPDELPEDWDPNLDYRLTVWEMVHHLVRVLNQGEQAAADLVAKLGARATSPASWPTGSTPSANARSAQPRRWPTTGWSRAGPRCCGWRGMQAGASRCRRGWSCESGEMVRFAHHDTAAQCTSLSC